MLGMLAQAVPGSSFLLPNLRLLHNTCNIVVVRNTGRKNRANAEEKYG